MLGSVTTRLGKTNETSSRFFGSLNPEKLLESVAFSAKWVRLQLASKEAFRVQMSLPRKGFKILKSNYELGSKVSMDT